MDQSDVAFIKAVIAFLLVAGTAMSAFWLWLRHRARPGTSPEFDRMLESLRQENAQLHAELGARMAEIEERVDFAERRLVQERAPSRLPPPTARTPV